MPRAQDAEDAGDAGSFDAGSSGAPDGGADAGSTRPRPSGLFPPVQKTLPTFSLEIASADLARLDADPRSDDFVPLTVTLDGVRATGTIRYRGSSTRTYPQKGFKIKLDPGQDLDGRDRFELLAEWQDGGKLSEKFAVDLFEAMGLIVPRARYARVLVNRKSNGLYLDMEHVGKRFLRAHGMEPDASVYRCGGRNGELKLPTTGPYQQDYERKTDETLPHTDLLDLLRFLNRADPEEFERDVARRIDLEAYLGNLAADALISNVLVEDSRSYWVHEAAKDEWTYVPWDLNNALFKQNRMWKWTDAPIVTRAVPVFSVYDPFVQVMYDERLPQRSTYRPTWSVLNTRLWDTPAFRDEIVRWLSFALAGPFSDERAIAHVDALEALIAGERQKDPFIDPDHALVASDYLKRYLRGRRAYLERQVRVLEAHGAGDLVVNEVGFGDPQRPGYVELFNRGSLPVSLAGRSIAIDLRSPWMHRFSSTQSLPARGRLLLIADGEPSRGRDHLPFRIPVDGGEIGVFDVGRVYGPSDVLYFGPHAPGTALGRVGDGEERIGVVAQTPGQAN